MVKSFPLVSSFCSSLLSLSSKEQSPPTLMTFIVYDATLDLAVILDPKTSLPYIIRSYENHKIFGRSTNDLLLQDYALVDGIMLPRRFKIYYNGDLLLTDYVADEVLVNTNLEPTLFNAPGSRAEANIPTRDSSYDFAEIGGFYQSYLWNGPYGGSLSNISASNPYPDLPGVWIVVVEDAPLYRQMVLELDDSVVVLDAPPHQSHLIMQWAIQTLGKAVTHVWVCFVLMHLAGRSSISTGPNID